MPLYHFTDSRNLESIRRYGLLSWKRLLMRNIPHWPASNSLSRHLDERVGLEDYIHFCVRREHPMATKALMEGRINDYVWIEVDDEIIRWRATRFSSDNAASNRAIVDASPETALNSDSHQAEVLVLGGLNTKWITFPQTSTAELFYDDIPF